MSSNKGGDRVKRHVAAPRQGDDEKEAEKEAESEGEDESDPFVRFAKFTEERRKLPWEQWTRREKVVYYFDRVFLTLLVLFLVGLLGEVGSKLWQVTDVNKIAAGLRSLVTDEPADERKRRFDL